MIIFKGRFRGGGGGGGSEGCSPPFPLYLANKTLSLLCVSKADLFRELCITTNTNNIYVTIPVVQQETSFSSRVLPKTGFDCGLHLQLQKF